MIQKKITFFLLSFFLANVVTCYFLSWYFLSDHRCFISQHWVTQLVKGRLVIYPSSVPNRRFSWDSWNLPSVLRIKKFQNLEKKKKTDHTRCKLFFDWRLPLDFDFTIVFIKKSRPKIRDVVYPVWKTIIFPIYSRTRDTKRRCLAITRKHNRI